MNIEEFLNFIGEYGHGVFTYSIAKPLGTNPDTLRHYVKRNEDMFDVYIGENYSQAFIIKMKKELYSKLQIDSKPTKSDADSSLTDIVLLNSFLAENKARIKWSYSPHFKILHNDQKIGIVSQNWSISKPFYEYDTLLILNKFINESNFETISRNLANRDKTSLEESQNFLRTNLYTPNCLKYFKSKFN